MAGRVTTRGPRSLAAASVLLALAASAPPPARAQDAADVIGPTSDREADYADYFALVPTSVAGSDRTGHAATALLMRQLRGVKRALMIGAHPDDENTTLLAVLARGLGARTAYLSLTRGDGGQNLIGSELWEGLGAIRTGELEAARRIDGGSQFFTRAFDFGYSKTAEETFSIWPREQVLSDMAWVVRSFRPQVVISVWRGEAGDGHGHHQAAGILAREVFRLAGDPESFPEHGIEAWSPSKYYHSLRRRSFRAGASDGSEEIVTLAAGRLDPLLDASARQVSGESRSLHRSQDMGSPQAPGPATTGAVFVEGSVPPGAGLFAGIDTTLVGAARGLPAAARSLAVAALEDYERSLGAAERAFGLDLAETANHLSDALGHLQRAHLEGRRAGYADPEYRLAIETKLTVVVGALLASAGVITEVRASRALLVPDSEALVSVLVWNGSPLPLRNPEVAVDLPEGWTAALASVDGARAGDQTTGGTVAPGEMATFTFSVRVPEEAESSRLYYLRGERDRGSYPWPDEPSLRGLPREPAPVFGRISFTYGDGGSRVRLRQPWRYVGVDPARGEYDKAPLMAPRVSVAASPPALVWPRSRSNPAEFAVSVRTEDPEGASGKIELLPPEGWRVSPGSKTFELPGAGTETTASFELRPVGRPVAGERVIGVVATTSDGKEYKESFSLLDYDHIERTPLYAPAQLELSVMTVEVTDGLSVGYVMGSGDNGPEAIRQLGARVELLSEAQVRNGDFGDLDVIVIGIRAYETRPDLRAANRQLLDFARTGGTVVNQYNQYQFSSGEYAPYDLTIGRPAPRVSVETAPVAILEPDAPVFTSPNRITPADFEGWVQERGLYFASEWDAAFLPLLELNDPGEPPRRGSLLVAPIGDGVYVYAALSFFRQWAARVPGAYRLFANLISLDAEEWRSYLAGR